MAARNRMRFMYGKTASAITRMTAGNSASLPDENPGDAKEPHFPMDTARDRWACPSCPLPVERRRNGLDRPRHHVRPFARALVRADQVVANLDLDAVKA